MPRSSMRDTENRDPDKDEMEERSVMEAALSE
jgi:hypothetical protein